MELTFIFEAAGEDLTFHIHNLFVDLRVNWRLRCTFSLTKLSPHKSFASQ